MLEHPRIRTNQRPFIARYLLEAWEKQGHAVLRCSDPAALPEADALFMHVDLSVLPPAYRNLAGRFPAAINADIVDIRKRILSLNQVVPGDGYDGPVIIKSNLNHAGLPEHSATAPRTGFSRLAYRLQRKGRSWWKQWSAHLPTRFRSSAILGKEDYLMLPTPAAVPKPWWGDDALVIERFTPEFHDGLYVLREWYFLGEAEWNRTETGSDPILTSGKFRPDLVREVPENLRQLRREWKIDFGKIDYVIHDGKAVVFDVNKTPAFTRAPHLESSFQLLEALKGGIASFLR